MRRGARWKGSNTNVTKHYISLAFWKHPLSYVFKYFKLQTSVMVWNVTYVCVCVSLPAATWRHGTASACSHFAPYLPHNVPLETLLVPQLVTKFPAFYGTPRFNTVCTKAKHLSLSRARLIQYNSPVLFLLRSILMRSVHLYLRLTNGLFPSGFPNKTLYTFLLYPIHATRAVRLILHDSVSSTNQEAPHYAVFSSLLFLSPF